MMFLGGWMVFGWIIILGLIIWGIVVLVRRGSTTSGTSQKRDPLEIARERYARGEISKEEFEEIKKDLS